MYLDVSCVYPVKYMYLECILMYLKCILNAPFYSKRIHVHVFDMYPKGVTDTFGIHVRYIRIHQDTCILGASLVSRWLARWIHIGIYIKIHVSWTLHQDRYNKIHRDTKSRYMRDTYGIHSEIHTF